MLTLTFYHNLYVHLCHMHVYTLVGAVSCCSSSGNTSAFILDITIACTSVTVGTYIKHHECIVYSALTCYTRYIGYIYKFIHVFNLEGCTILIVSSSANSQCMCMVHGANSQCMVLFLSIGTHQKIIGFKRESLVLLVINQNQHNDYNTQTHCHTILCTL